MSPFTALRDISRQRNSLIASGRSGHRRSCAHSGQRSEWPWADMGQIEIPQCDSLTTAGILCCTPTKPVGTCPGC